MLQALETRLPPPILLVVLAAVVWLLPGAFYSRVCIAVGVLCLALGLSINAWSKVMFRTAHTTVNPLHPERSSALVTFGLYRYSRNPMYLGYAPVLLGWVMCRGQVLGLLAVALFIGYITVFQILPEERCLSARFQAQYAVYRAAVRRWL
ncbi:methyltransferase family protein [Xanthomonas arboricola]|uniref:methyltransferase family protein n=1 Tax=Xanthomonas arboricola TaxID=56448 RepID=UPI001EE7A23A|nr:isoprenylcysteine carboxylmethyltransferase family protein [Xanthomonas arboricola]